MRRPLTLLLGLCLLAGPAHADNFWTNSVRGDGLITITSPLLIVRIQEDPFQMVVTDREGNTLLAQRPADDPGNDGPAGPFAYAVEPASRALNQPLQIDPYLPRARTWHHATKLEGYSNFERDVHVLTLATNEDDVTLEIELTFLQPSNPAPDPPGVFNPPTQRNVLYPDVLRIRSVPSEVNGLEQMGDTFYCPPDEHFYGFGQLWDTLDSRGKRRPMQIELDLTGPQSLNDNSAPVPFYVSNKGYGLFAEMPTWGEFNLGGLQADKTSMTFSMWGGGDPKTPEGMLTYHVIYGPDPLRIIRRYNELTAMPPLPPKWNFGPHHWRNKLPDGERMIDFDMAGLRDNDIPASVMWFDAPWETAYNTFEFNTFQFPDANATIAKMKDNGFRLICWSTPFMNFTDDSSEQQGMLTNTGGLFEFGRDNEYYLKDPLQAGFFISPWWKGTGAWIDFTNPDAYDWYQALIRWAVRRGVDGFKLDDGYCADNAVFYGGETGLHKQYEWRLGFHRIYHEVLEEVLGDEGGGVLVNRTGNYGDQKYCQAFWPGDLINDYTYPFGFPSAITGGIALGVIGYPYYGSDIGGFVGGTPAKDVYAKWIQFGAFSPVMQNGGGGNHEPWDSSVWDAEILAVFKKYAKIHNQLFPYIYTYAHRAHEFGHPIMRGLYLHHMDDEQAQEANFSYYFGEAFLVAPTYQPGWDVPVYFPEGRYLSYWDDEVFEGPLQTSYQASLSDMALFVKSGSIVPMITYDVDTLADAKVPGVVDYEDRDHLRDVQVWPDGDSSFEVWDGTRYTCKEGIYEPSLEFTIENAPKARRYTLEFRYQARATGITSKPLYLEDLDGNRLTEVASLGDANACVACWSFDANAAVLYARVEGPETGFKAWHEETATAPKVRLAGFGPTSLVTGSPLPQALQMIALADGDLTGMEVHFQGISTGLTLADDGLRGDAVAGDGAYWLNWWLTLPIASGVVSEVPLELVPMQGDTRMPGAWPYLVVTN